MKNILFPLVICCAISCNNESKPTTSRDTVSIEKPMIAESNTVSQTGGNCSSLYLFKKGTMIEAVSYDKNGKETSRQQSTVLNVSTTDNGMSSEVEMKSNGTGKEEKIVTGKYTCDGKNLYVDLSNLFANMEAKGAVIEGDPISFPISVTEGELLPDVTYSMTMTTGGRQMKTVVHMKERKVGAKEKITTPAGTFDCYKITATSEADVQVEGMNEKAKKMMEAMKSTMPKQSFTMYYDPSVSIIRVEMYSGDNLVSHSDVVSIK